MKQLLVFVILFASLEPATAWSAPSDDAAIAADGAVVEHCAGAWSGEHSGKPAAILAVGEALMTVQAAYEAEKTPSLLYWRGALYKCLGQFEPALDDLEAFVRAERANPAYAQQVKTAAVQLKRAGRALEARGAGDAAQWIRRTDPFEVSLRLGAGLAVRSRICNEDNPAIYASLCLPSGGAPVVAVGALPVGGRFALAGFFAPPIGLGASLTGQWAWPDESREIVVPKNAEIETVGPDPLEKNNSIDWGVSQPSLVAAAGPVIRIANWRSEGRAAGVRIEPQLAVGVSWFEPVAGHYRFADNADAFQTFGGECLAVHLGASVRVGGQAEVGNNATLLFDVRVAVFGPASGDQLIESRPIGGNVLAPLAPERADRVAADGGFAVLGVPPGRGVVALGPSLQFGFEGRWMTFPEGAEHAWIGDRTPPEGASPDSKIFSTLRLKASAVLGLTLEFGGPKPR